MSLDEKLSMMLDKEMCSCPVQRVAGEMSAEEANMFERLLDMPHVSTRSLHDALRSEDYSISRESLTRHRKGICGCHLEQQ